MITQVLREAQGVVSLNALAEGFTSFNMSVIEREVLNATNHMETVGLTEALLRTLVGGGQAAQQVSPTVSMRSAASEMRVSKLRTSFDIEHPTAQAWAEARAAELVVEITEETREGLRDVVSGMFSEGVPPRVAARAIRDSIGLNSRQALAVLRARERLLNAKPGTLVKVGKKTTRIPKQGLSTKQVENLTSRYAASSLVKRSETIAIHESNTAANEGQRQMWLQAASNGEISSLAEREWIVADPCPICAPLDGTRASLTGTFPGGFSGPPAHVRCKCTQGLADPKPPAALQRRVSN